MCAAGLDCLIARDDLHRCRFGDAPPPEPQDGQALLAIDAFGLSANNITYEAFASGTISPFTGSVTAGQTYVARAWLDSIRRSTD